jgi:uncharacterized protein (TIGR03435 family)
MILRTLLALWTSVARPMGDHLWQSTLFLAIAAILALVLRKNQARVRYWVWLTVSVKFLIPFSLLIALGSHLAKPRVSAPAQVVVYSAVEDFSQPFAGQPMPVIFHSAPAAAPVGLLHLLPAMVAALWLIGIVFVLIRWAVGWIRISLMLRNAASVSEGPEVEALRRLESSLGVRTPIRLVQSPDWMEPGIFGIFGPVLIWPQGISQHLGDRHIEAILAHEVCHARRRDNLSAVLHMLVEAIFWFHPLVWWIGARLEEERERACDEEVSLLCNQPHVYAESILRVCKFCSESPLACVSGITGADLKKRIVLIMTGRVVRKLDFGRKLLLLTVGLAVVAVPLVLGQVKAAQRMMLTAADKAPMPFRTAANAMIALEQLPSSEEIAQTSVSAGPSALTTGDPFAPSFDVATIKPHPASAPQIMNWMGIRNTPDGMEAASATLPMLIQRAYGLVSPDQVFGGPEWAKSARFDIKAKMSDAEIAHMQKLGPAEAKARRELMMQGLLAERFRLKFHSEIKQLPVFELVVAKGGPKLTDATTDLNPSLEKGEDGKPLVMFSQATERTMVAQGLSTKALAGYLSQPTSGLERPVVDKTGLDGTYDFVLNWVPHWNRFLRGSGDGSVSPEEAAELFDALKQIGLKLQPAAAPVEIVVIDQVEKPSVDGAEVADSGTGRLIPAALAQKEGPGNPSHIASSGTDAAQTSHLATFEVATVKPAPPDADPNSGYWSYPGIGRFTASHLSLARLIGLAYDIDATQIANQPNWLGVNLYDIEAKPEAGIRLTREELRPRLQALLEQRFHLVAHTETRLVQGYALVIGKGGEHLTPTKGALFPGYSVDTSRGQMRGKDWTMPRLAQFLTHAAGLPVVDQTGLAGSYDIAFSYNPKPDADSALPPLDVALKQATGLLLKPEKVPAETIVIDSVDKDPTPN